MFARVHFGHLNHCEYMLPPGNRPQDLSVVFRREIIIQWSLIVSVPWPENCPYSCMRRMIYAGFVADRAWQVGRSRARVGDDTAVSATVRKRDVPKDLEC